MSTRLQRLRIETHRHTIEGSVELPAEGFRSRTTDFLNAHATDFVAVTDARVVPAEGGAATELPFLAVSARHIVLVSELGETA